MKAIYIVLLAFAVSGFAQRTEPRETGAAVPDGAALAAFETRVEAYAALRADLEKGAARLSRSASPEEITEAQQALAARVREARAGAKQGDIFSPDIERRLRTLVNPELQGTRGQNNRGIIWDEGPGPGAFAPRVNAEYPRDQPLSTVPPTILEALPLLPDGLEFRFVGRHLILRDARANLIVDYIENAI